MSTAAMVSTAKCRWRRLLLALAAAAGKCKRRDGAGVGGAALARRPMESVKCLTLSGSEEKKATGAGASMAVVVGVDVGCLVEASGAKMKAGQT